MDEHIMFVWGFAFNKHNCNYEADVLQVNSVYIIIGDAGCCDEFN